MNRKCKWQITINITFVCGSSGIIYCICTSSYFLHKKIQVLAITQKFLFLWKSLQHQPIQHQYSVMFCHNISYRLLKCALEWWPGKCLPGYLGGRKWGEEAETIWILLTDWQPYNNSSNNTYLRLRLAVVEHAGLVVGRVHLRPSVTCAVPVNKPWRGKQTDSRKSSFEHRKHFHHTLSGSDNLLAAPFRRHFLLWQQELSPKTSLKKKKEPSWALENVQEPRVQDVQLTESYSKCFSFRSIELTRRRKNTGYVCWKSLK